MRLELDDLPPAWRKQAEAQLVSREKKKNGLEAAVRAAERAGKKFDSRGEAEYYINVILPGIQSGRIASAQQHVRFEVLPKRKYCGKKYPAAHYTPDFVVQFSTGEVEVVEIKSKFTRRAQRDYIYRRRLFIDNVAEPRGWKFTEIVTGDDRDDIKAWKARASE